MNRLLIKNCMLTTFFNDGYNATKILEGVDILIEAGKILRIDKDIPAEGDCRIIDGSGKLAAPGFVNGRSRSMASLVSKSIAVDIKCSRFGDTPLYIRINPFINIAQEVLSDDEMKALLRLTMHEAIRSGTTTMLEHCSVRELPLFLALCEELGMRAVASPMLMSRHALPETDAWGVCSNELEEIDEAALVDWNRSVVEASAGKLACAGMGLGSVETVSESLMRRVGKAAFDLDCLLMVPMNETKQEREVSMERFGLTPAELLHKNHVLHRKTIVGGNLHATREDRRILRSGGSAVALNPIDALHDARVTPFLDFQYDDLQILIGSGHSTVDMCEQIRMLTLAGKLERGLRHQMRAQKSFFAATTGGAQAATLPVGELDEGLNADLVLIDLAQPHYRPLTLPITDLIYNTAAADITEVIIAGRVVKENGKVLGMDRHTLIHEAEAAMDKVWTRARETGTL